MNSQGRRKARRAWLEKNRDELDRLANWIVQSEQYVFRGRFFKEGILELDPEQKEAFGKGSRTRKQWKRYLEIELGISLEADLRT